MATGSSSRSRRTITSDPATDLEPGRYVYQITATDADGAPLTSGLSTAPPGMKMDGETGLLAWEVDAKAGGTHRVRVTVSDGHEEEATWQEFEIALNGAREDER